MAYFFPEGTKFYYSSTFATAKTIASATNADPTVLGCVGHGYVDADPLLFLSGWEEANGSVFEADQLTADTFSLVNLNSTDTTLYPAGTGTGTTKKISGWVEIPQVLTVTDSGGGAKYGTVSPLSARQDIRQAIGFEASGIDLELGYDADNAALVDMWALSRTRSKVALKIWIPGGGRVYGYGTLMTGNMPKMSKGNAITVKSSLSFDSQITVYGA